MYHAEFVQQNIECHNIFVQCILTKNIFGGHNTLNGGIIAWFNPLCRALGENINHYSMLMRHGISSVAHMKVIYTIYPKKYAHGFCFAVLCCGYTLTDFPISIRLTSLALWQSNDCPSASKATLMNMDKYFMWIHFERLHNHNKAKHNNTVCIFLGIYCKECQITDNSMIVRKLVRVSNKVKNDISWEGNLDWL